MTRFVTAALLFFTMCLPVSVCAAEVITVDPNASAARTTEGIAPDGDPRLAQKVTYQAKRKTVLTILTDLSSQTGVTFKAGYSDEDWQVRDRRMNIFVKDIPLSNLMNSIARVMKFEWSKSDFGDVTSYRLYMDREVVLGAERQGLMEEEMLEKRKSEKREKLLSGLDAAANMSEDELEALKLKSPAMYEMARSSLGSQLLGICTEVPGAREAFISGEEFTVGVGSMSKELQKKFDSSFEACGGNVTITGSKTPGPLTTYVMKVTSASSEAYYTAGSIGDPYGELEDLRARITYASDENERDQLKMEWDIARESEVTEQTTGTGELSIEHPDDPALSTKIKMKLENKEFANTLSALTEASNFNVVSDSFELNMPSLKLPECETAVRTMLDDIQTQCRYNWERHGSTLELHDRDWFRKRMQQIPEAWLAQWRESFKEKGFLDIDIQSQIAKLTQEQIKACVCQDEVLGKAGPMNLWNLGNRDLLRAYAALSKPRQALIFTKNGLSLDSLADNQLAAVQSLFQHCANQRGLRLIGIRKTENKRTYYDCSIVTSSGGSTGAAWIVSCPTYTPLDDKKPKNTALQ